MPASSRSRSVRGDPRRERLDESDAVERSGRSPVATAPTSASRRSATPKVMEQAFFARDLAGTLVQVGVPTPEMKIDLPMIEFFGRGGRLRPSWYGDCLPSRDFPMLISLYLQGRLDLDRFVSETIGLDGVEEAFHRMERVRCCGRSSAISRLSDPFRRDRAVSP